MSTVPLTRETIDNIFEPRRAIRTANELEVAYGRLLTDGKGRYFCLNREGHSDQYRGRYSAFYFRKLNRRQPEAELYYGHHRAWKKGTYPAWIEDDGERHTPWSARPYADLPCFECLPEPVTQGEILLAFYHIAFPDYDNIVKIDSWPTVSEKTWKYIWEKFAAFDRRMFPNVLPGGAWGLGCGFSADRRVGYTVRDWEIDTSTANWVYKWTPYYFRIHRNDYGPDENPTEWSSFYPYQIWDGGLKERMENSDGLGRHNSFDLAAQGCRKLAGCALDWAEAPSEHGAAWQSQLIEPVRKAA